MIEVLLALALLIAIVIYAFKLAPGTRSGKFKGLLVGHRGCRRFDNIPENTLEAFKFAVSNDAPSIELDCRETKDGKVVVFHDDDCSRLFANVPKGTKYVSDMTYEELLTYRYADTTDENIKIPLLSEVFEYCLSTNTKVFVEIKAMYVKDALSLSHKVVQLFQQYKMHDLACIIAFSPLVVYKVRQLDPNIEVCILYADDVYTYSRSNRLEKITWFVEVFAKGIDVFMKNLCRYFIPWFTGCTMVGPDSKVTSQADLVSYEERGLDVYTWTVNDQCEFDLFMKYNASIGTDILFPKLKA